MNLDLTEEQEMLRTMARDFFEKELPKTLVRELEEDEKGYSPDLWRKMADLGLMGLPIPEKYGGTEGKFLDLCILLEEAGRACLPGPYFSTVVLGALTILDAGTEEQKQSFLPKLANGDIIMTMAVTEPSARYDAAGIETQATAEGDDYVISGTKLFIHDAHLADYIITAARTKKGADPQEGITLFIVDAKSPGITITPLRTIALDKQCEVVFDKVRVPKANILGEVDGGWKIVQKAMERAAVAKCAESLGGAQMALNMSVDYAKERVAYGRPIGSFQAIQHYCANMWMSVDGARNITYYAAWLIDEGLPATKEVAIAKGWVNEAYKWVSERGVQIHGAIGITRDHDMGLYYRRAKANELAFGDTDFQKEIIARELGL